MLDFEKIEGFVLDLTIEEYCNEILEDILCGDNNEYQKVIKYDLQEKRNYIVKYFTDTYKYVFCRSLNVYQVYEDTLKTTKEDLIIIIQNAIGTLEDGEYEHDAILDYLGITEEQYKFFKSLDT